MIENVFYDYVVIGNILSRIICNVVSFLVFYCLSILLYLHAQIHVCVKQCYPLLVQLLLLNPLLPSTSLIFHRVGERWSLIEAPPLSGASTVPSLADRLLLVCKEKKKNCWLPASFSGCVVVQFW